MTQDVVKKTHGKLNRLYGATRPIEGSSNGFNDVQCFVEIPVQMYDALIVEANEKDKALFDTQLDGYTKFAEKYDVTVLHLERRTISENDKKHVMVLRFEFNQSVLDPLRATRLILEQMYL